MSSHQSSDNQSKKSTTEQQSHQKILKMIIAGALAFVLGFAFLYVSTIEKPIGEEYKPIYEYGGDFTLKTLSKDISLIDYRDKVVIIYFGFLSCTEACPISMGTITKAINILSPEERDKLQVLFVSLDPERDSYENLDKFSAYYKKRYKDESNPEIIIATTGSVSEIEALSKQYGVFFDLVDLEDSSMDYTVDHSSRFYMIDTNGKLITTMSHSTTPIELAAKTSEIQQTSTKNTATTKTVQITSENNNVSQETELNTQ